MSDNDATSFEDVEAAAADAVDEMAVTIAEGKTLWAFTLSHPLLAQEAMLAAMRLSARGHLTLDDAAIVHKQEGGKVRIVQTKDISTTQGAMSGGCLLYTSPSPRD